MIFRTYEERIGERRGMRKGKLAGKLEGKLESTQESIFQLLELRFGAVPERVQEAIRAMTDQPTLAELFTHAFKCRSLKAFEARLPKQAENAS